MKLNEVNSGIHKHKRSGGLVGDLVRGEERRPRGVVKASGRGLGLSRCLPFRVVQRRWCGGFRSGDSTIALPC